MSITNKCMNKSRHLLYHAKQVKSYMPKHVSRSSLGIEYGWVTDYMCTK